MCVLPTCGAINIAVYSPKGHPVLHCGKLVLHASSCSVRFQIQSRAGHSLPCWPNLIGLAVDTALGVKWTISSRPFPQRSSRVGLSIDVSSNGLGLLIVGLLRSVLAHPSGGPKEGGDMAFLLVVFRDGDLFSGSFRLGERVLLSLSLDLGEGGNGLVISVVSADLRAGGLASSSIGSRDNDFASGTIGLNLRGPGP
jgi:hypothetical protein